MGLTVGLLVASHGIYLRLLGFRTYGVWLLLNTVLAFSQLGNFGVSQAVTKLVAEATGRESIEEAERYQASASAMMVLTGGLGVAATLILRPWLPRWLGLGADEAVFQLLLLPMSILSGYVLVVQSTAGALAGVGRVDISNYASLGGRVVGLLLTLPLLSAGHGLVGLFIGQAVGTALTHVTTLYFLKRHGFKLVGPGRFSMAAARRLLDVGSAVFGGSLMNLMMSPLNRLLVARGVGAEGVPIFEVAYSVALQLRAVTDAAMRALMPEVSRLSAQGVLGRERIATLLTSTTLKSVAAGFALHAVAFAGADLALHLWLGNVPAVQVTALRVMLVATCLSIVGVPAYQALLGAGHARLCFAAHAIQGAINAISAVTVLLLAPTQTILYVASAGLGLVVAHFFLAFVARRTLVLAA